MVFQNKEPLLILACAAYPTGHGLTPEFLRYKSGVRKGSGCGAKTGYLGRVAKTARVPGKQPRQVPLANMAARASRPAAFSGPPRFNQQPTTV